MVMDVKCAFLYGEIQRSVYIELPHADTRYGDGTKAVKLEKTMCGTGDAPRIWAVVVRPMDCHGYKQSAFQPAVYCSLEEYVVVVAHVGVRS